MIVFWLSYNGGVRLRVSRYRGIWLVIRVREWWFWGGCSGDLVGRFMFNLKLIWVLDWNKNENLVFYDWLLLVIESFFVFIINMFVVYSIYST